jgi:predicted metal-binding membrane protein
MKIKMVMVILLITALSSALFAGVLPSAEELSPLDAMIDKMMEGYNAVDATAFYADWAVMMAGICTPQAFKSLYVDNYMKTFGAYVSRTVNADESVVMADVPNGLLVYHAKFANNENVKMSVNLIKENNIWKIQQLTIQAMP